MFIKLITSSTINLFLFLFVDERNCSFMGRGLEEAASWKSEVPFLEGSITIQSSLDQDLDADEENLQIGQLV